MADNIQPEHLLEPGGNPDNGQQSPASQPARPVPALPAGAVNIAGTLLVPAGFWLRFWAFLIDCAALTLLHEILLLVSGVELPGPADLIESLSLSLETLLSGGVMSASALERMTDLNRIALFSGWLNVGLCAAYFTVFHGISGQTLGKLCIGIRVLRADGTALGISRALLRYLAYLVSARLVYTAWLIPFDANRRTLYDLLLKTNVFKPLRH